MASRIALTIENNGSVARDHLASERTFLAYVRTSLALASAGVALVQLFSVTRASSSPSVAAFNMNTYARPLGATAILLGLMVLFIGVARFFSIQNKLIEGMFPVSRLFTVGTALSITTLIAVVFALLVAER